MIHTEEYRKYAFFGLLIFLLCLFYFMIKPYLTFAILGMIIGIGAYPLYLKILKVTKKENQAAFLTVILILLIIVIPAFVITSAVVKETIGFVTTIDAAQINSVVQKISGLFGSSIDIHPQINSFLSSMSQGVVSSTWTIIGSVTDTLIGLLLMFMIIYYCLKDGPLWVERMSSFAPFDAYRKKILVDKIKTVTKTVIYVEILIAIIQGILGGFSFYLAGIPNPIFWGFIMALLAFLPFVGTGLVWAPAALLKFVNNEVGAGVFLLIYGIAVIGGIDYYLRPKIVSGGSRIHPLTALLGAFGGLKLLGFPGLIIGPLIAALLEAVVIFHYEDAINHKKTNSKTKRK